MVNPPGDTSPEQPGRAPAPPESREPAAPESADAFWKLPGGVTASTLSDEQLRQLENEGVSSVSRSSDQSEATADEKQDVTTSLNFPLHWTSAKESWNYLFDIAVACELLAVRPDDLVLDFAAGTCWATETLCRLGVRTVSIDLSVEMMRRGRRRLDADSRLVFRQDAAFVVTRGQQLPFADNSFEGVLCMNALHHLPSYAEALREIYRVLKPGGRAVFSEPGTAHAGHGLSAFRVREESVIEKSVHLPLVRRHAIAAGFTRMRVVPLRSADAYAFDYTASAADAASLEALWVETMRHSPKEHARFVLYKGDNPPDDTLLPAHQFVERLGARIELARIIGVAVAGAEFVDRLRITNTGSVTWRARGRRFGGQVTAGLKVCDRSSSVLREELGRTPLSGDVAPGNTIEIDMHVVADLEPGEYQLRYDMVVEGVTWFEFQGSQCARRTLAVQP